MTVSHPAGRHSRPAADIVALAATSGGLYDERPELYDAVQSDWDYDRDVGFVSDALADRGVDPERLLEVGCGTGEHTRRLAARGLNVAPVDVHEGALRVAREKCADVERVAVADGYGPGDARSAFVAVR